MSSDCQEMKKNLLLLIFSLTWWQILNSQTVVTHGKPIAEIFTDFHYTFNDTSQTTGFGIKRAYLGYNFQPEGNFSSTIIVNIGSPEELSLGSTSRRYAFFREASVTYSKERLNLSFGIASTRIFRFQQRFWGKRYIANSYQALNGYGTVADLGIVMDYIFNDRLTVDLSIMNGQGYSDIQIDNSLKKSIGITITPVNQLSIRLYGDIMKPRGILQATMIAFAGFKNDLITFGAEASYKSNIDLTEGHHAWGLSATGAISLSENTELFARYDYSSSVIVPGDITRWNFLMDRSFAVFGFQYTFSQNVKLALNYQGTYPVYYDREVTDAIFINALFKF
jgi:hypothetical protein